MNKLKECCKDKFANLYLNLQMYWDECPVIMRDLFYIPFFLLIEVVLKRNIIINFWLGLILSLLFLYHKDSNLSNYAVGVLSSSFAAFNLIDGYTFYKNRYAEIIVMSNLRAYTGDFLETILTLLENLFDEELIVARDENDKDREKVLYKMINLKGDLWLKHQNLDKQVLENLNKFLKMIVDYDDKYDLERKEINFKVAPKQLKKIKDVFSNNLPLFSDGSLIKVYSELILLTGDFDKTILPENDYSNNNEAKLLSDTVYVLIPCYNCLLKHNKEINNYVRLRNKKHYNFVERQ